MVSDSATNTPDPRAEGHIDPTRPHSARVYDYVLGGETHYAADRALGDQMSAVLPGGLAFAHHLTRRNRAFLARTVRHLAQEHGVRQFLDIGAGIPAYDNTHEVAQAVAPESRVVYVDYDPIVQAHAHRRLVGSDAAGGEGVNPEDLVDGETPSKFTFGRSAYVHADFRDPEQIVSAAGETLDFDQPVAVMMIALLHLVAEDRDPYGVVSRLMDVVPSGSYLIISQFTHDVLTDAMKQMTAVYESSGEPLVMRPHAEVSRFFDGLELVDPGVVLVNDWRPEVHEKDVEVASLYGGVARKP